MDERGGINMVHHPHVGEIGVAPLTLLVILHCPFCKRLGEVIYIGSSFFGSKGRGGKWRCRKCGCTFSTGPALTQSLMEGGDGYR